MVNKVFKEIWAMGVRKCAECKKLKNHYANDMCMSCYHKNRGKNKKTNKEENKNE